MSLILTLASRNLFQDRLRFIATLVGIVFSVVLVMVQLGLYLGFGRMVTAMIDHACAQCAISLYIEDGRLAREERVDCNAYQLRSVS